jgi:hypothetical protein
VTLVKRRYVIEADTGHGAVKLIDERDPVEAFDLEETVIRYKVIEDAK